MLNNVFIYTKSTIAVETYMTMVTACILEKMYMANHYSGLC